MAEKTSSRPSAREVKRLVEVSIDGKPVSFRSDADQAFLDDLARFFEERFKEVGSRRVSNPFTQAVLAGLNIAEELFRERTRGQDLRKGVRDRCQRIQELLDHLDPERRRG